MQAETRNSWVRAKSLITQGPAHRSMSISLCICYPCPQVPWKQCNGGLRRTLPMQRLCIPAEEPSAWGTHIFMADIRQACPLSPTETLPHLSRLFPSNTTWEIAWVKNLRGPAVWACPVGHVGVLETCRGLITWHMCRYCKYFDMHTLF